MHPNSATERQGRHNTETLSMVTGEEEEWR